MNSLCTTCLSTSSLTCGICIDGHEERNAKVVLQGSINSTKPKNLWQSTSKKNQEDMKKFSLLNLLKNNR